MNRFDNESRRTAEARNGNGGELGAAARELSKIAVEETKRTTGLSQRAAYRKRLFEMRRGLNGEYRRNYALAAGSVFCGAVGEVLVNEYYRVEKQLRIAAAEAESLKFGRLRRRAAFAAQCLQRNSANFAAVHRALAPSLSFSMSTSKTDP